MLEASYASIVLLGSPSPITASEVAISFFISRVLSKMFSWGSICKGEESEKTTETVRVYRCLPCKELGQTRKVVSIIMAKNTGFALPLLELEFQLYSYKVFESLFS
jgi:hypothetical protein